MQKPLNKSPTPWYKWLNNNGVIKILEFIQDFIIISLCLGLFGFMTSDPQRLPPQSLAKQDDGAKHRSPKGARERASVDASVARDVRVVATAFKLYASYG